MSITPTRLATMIAFNERRIDLSGEVDVHPANASRHENASWRNTAPAMAVNIGDRNCRTVASDSERYCSE